MMSERDMTPDELRSAVLFFGCDVDNGTIGDAVIQWEDGSDAKPHSGPGWYIWCGEYEDEGSSFISADEYFAPLRKYLDQQDARDGTDPENRP